MSSGIEEDILRLEIAADDQHWSTPRTGRDSPVHNVVLVEMFQRENQFGDVEPRPILAESSFLLEVPEKLSPALVVGNKVQLLFRLERKLEADEEGALQRSLEDLPLADSMRDLFLRHNLLLGEHLHGVDSAGVLLSHLKDAAKSPAADELQEFKVGGFEVDFALRTVSA
jgi:hypothetical protein